MRGREGRVGGKTGSSELPLFVHECTKMSEGRHRAFLECDSTPPRICLDFRPIGFLDLSRFPEEIPMESGADSSFGSRKTVHGFQCSGLKSRDPVGKNPSPARKGLDLAGTRLLFLESCTGWLLGTPSKPPFRGSGA